MKFPEDFYWGAATSAHQVEGSNRNDWAEWEMENAKVKMLENQRFSSESPKPKTRGRWQKAKGTEWPDFILRNYPNPLQAENYISGRACDHYNQFREDFDIAKQLGHNAHRFSIEWSRIEPEEGKFDEKEIEHYRGVIRALKGRGLEPFTTLWHFTNPLWARDQGGWENPKTIKDFLRYVEKIATAFGHEVRFWIPINEPTVYAGNGYLRGLYPPEATNYRRANRVLRNLVRAHQGAYALLHKHLGDAILVGSAHRIDYHEPSRRWSPFDWIGTKIFQYVRDLRALSRFGRVQDFIGLNYYYRDRVQLTLRAARFGPLDVLEGSAPEVSDLGWDISPAGIYRVLENLKKFNVPIFITENGVADSRDVQRAKFIREHLGWVAKAIQEGVDVRGYFHWSLLDNFEWDKGFWPRFGLVEVDYRTMERKIRPSAWEYQSIIRAGL